MTTQMPCLNAVNTCAFVHWMDFHYKNRDSRHETCPHGKKCSYITTVANRAKKDNLPLLDVCKLHAARFLHKPTVDRSISELGWTGGTAADAVLVRKQYDDSSSSSSSAGISSCSATTSASARLTTWVRPPKYHFRKPIGDVKCCVQIAHTYGPSITLKTSQCRNFVELGSDLCSKHKRSYNKLALETGIKLLASEGVDELSG